MGWLPWMSMKRPVRSHGDVQTQEGQPGESVLSRHQLFRNHASVSGVFENSGKELCYNRPERHVLVACISLITTHLKPVFGDSCLMLRLDWSQAEMSGARMKSCFKMMECPVPLFNIPKTSDDGTNCEG